MTLSDGVLTITKPSNWSAGRISILLTAIALCLWSFSVLQAKLNIGFFGLADSFSVIYFISLGMLTLASAVLWPLKENHEKLLFFQVSLLIISLWLVPLLIGGSQPVESHVIDKFIDNTYPILKNGTMGNTQYSNWPAFYIFGANLMKVLGLSDAQGLVFVTPCLLQFLFLLPLYVFLRNMFGAGQYNYYWAGIWIFEMANWLEQSYLGPQAIALFLILLLLALLTKSLNARNASGRMYIVTSGVSLGIILIAACLTVTHLLSSVIALMIVVLVFLVNRKGKMLPFVLMFVMFVAGWMIYQTTTVFESRFPQYFERAMSLDLAIFDVFGSASRTQDISGSGTHNIVSNIRILTTAIFAFTSLAGLIVSWRLKDNRLSDRTVLAVAVSTFLGFLSGLYSSELIQRTWYFFLPVATYFSARLLRHRATGIILTVLLLTSIFPHFISHYGNEEGDYVSPASYDGIAYLNNLDSRTSAPIVILGYPYTAEESPVSVQNDDIEYDDTGLELIDHYIQIGNRQVNQFGFFGNSADFVKQVWATLDSSNSYSLIYQNPDYAIFHFTDMR